MSRFAVTLERIARVWTHTNADRLEMAQVQSMSYQFVIAKGQFKPGDLVVYFPIDSLLPQQISSRLGLEGKLAGAEKNRVKTVRLRGEISQGVVAEPSLLLTDWADNGYHEGQDITALLGVTKYEPPAINSQYGKLVALPPLVSVYDIEGAERYGALLVKLLNEPVMITEKLEGSHFSVALYKDGDLAICQRRYRIEPLDGAEHDWHKVTRLLRLAEKLPSLKTEIGRLRGSAVEMVNLRGEMIGPGIQANYYRLKQHQVRFFEIEANGEALSAPEFLALMRQFDLPTVPVLAETVLLRDYLNGQSLATASDGASALNSDLLREGIVLRPLVEMRDDGIGRVILKQRSPQYLAGSEF